MISRLPRKQRKMWHSATIKERHKRISVHLNRELIEKYSPRAVPVRKGDTVKVLRGAFKGHEGKVAKVHLKRSLVEIDGMVITKADGKQKPRKIHTSNLVITKLDLSDSLRRRRLEGKPSIREKEEIIKKIEKGEEEIEEKEKEIDEGIEKIEEGIEEIEEEEKEIDKKVEKIEKEEEKK